MTKYTVKFTTQFKKDYKLAIKRGLKIDLLEQIVICSESKQCRTEKPVRHFSVSSFHILVIGL